MPHLFRVLIFGCCLLTACAHVAGDTLLFDEALAAAGSTGDKAKIEALLAKGFDVNAKIEQKGRFHQTMLHEAAGYGTKEVIELLLAKGANINAKDGLGETPLHSAVNHRRKDIAELLLAKGADINAMDKEGRTSLHWAANMGWEKGVKDIGELLLAKGADVNAKDRGGQTPLHRAAFCVFSYCRNRGTNDVAELLLAKGADANAKDQNGETPLHDAAYYGMKDVAELLLANGADVNARSLYSGTPRDVAESRRENAILELLNEHLANEVRLRNEHRLKQAKLREDLIKSNPRAALVQLTAQLKGNPTDDTIRSLIIKLADELKPAPAIPEEARKHFVEGTAIVKAAKNPAQQALAAQSFTEALTVAPWWGDAYYNLGVAQELAEQFDKAEHAFTFYLLSNPGATEEREVQDRIYQLSAKRKLSGAK